MSDLDAADARPTAVAAATQALAIQELNDEIGGLRKQFKALWIAVGVIGTITLILAILTILPRFGVRMGGAGFPGRTGTMNGTQFNGGAGGPGTQQSPGQ